MFTDPQNKLNQQANSQPSVNSKQQDSKGTIDQNQQSRPINSTPDPNSRLKPDTNPKLNDQASATITDESGASRTVPEAEEESGFKAALKRKLMNTVTSKMSSSNSTQNANGDLKSEEQPTRNTPETKKGPGDPKPNQPKPAPPKPNVPKAKRPQKPNLPKFPQKTTTRMPRIGKPRI